MKYAREQQILGGNEQDADNSGNTQRAAKRAQRLGIIASPEGLGCQASRSHTEKAENPIDKVENHTAYSNGTEIGRRTEVPDDGGIDHTEQWHGDIGDDAGDSYAKNVTVHDAEGGFILTENELP